MQKKAQFDDRIRNLLALAQDGAPRSRTLLFSHISDLFLQKRPMASATQVRMLTEILKELLDQVELSTRQDVAAALCALNDPPEELINLLSEDVIEVSGPLLEKAILPDERLIHIIRYGGEAHRIHISRRFGLSPLVRQELEKAHQESASSKLKFSLNDLEKLAGDQTPDLDEETTADILELLRAQKIHAPYPQSDSGRTDGPEDDTPPAAEKKPPVTVRENIHFVEPSIFSPPVQMIRPARRPEQPQPPERQQDMARSAPGKSAVGETEPAAPKAPHDGAARENSRMFPRDAAANDAALPDSVIHMENNAPDLARDIWRQARDARGETSKQREFVRTVADWFWEVDRNGALTFLSEEAFTVFGRPAAALTGEDFISLCHSPDADKNADPAATTFEALFEHRASFRDVPFYISAAKGEKSLWRLSAIAIFDIHTGRFTGFRGSARAESDAESDVGDASAVAAAGDAAPGGNAASPVSPAPVTQPAAREDAAAELLYNLSHEFRTPLNAIIGFSEMIDMETWGPVNPQYHQHTKNILAAAGQLKEAVNDVLDSAKLEAGLFQIDPESFSLKATLKDCMANVAAMARDHGVQLAESDNNIDVILYNDRQSVELCLTKMLACSLKRARGGEIISPSVLINSNAQVRIEIPILGPEILEKDGEKLFRKLQSEPDGKKISPSPGEEYEAKIASGFGLAIARDLARMIGGDITSHVTKGRITHLALTLSNHDLPS